MKKLKPHRMCLTPAELKAIEDHKYFMSKELNRDVTIEEAIQDFFERYLEQWKRTKQKEDNFAQINEIERHKFLKSQERGYDVGYKEATEEWVVKYAPDWRAHRESLERNGFISMSAQIKILKGLHVRPTFALSGLACSYDCDIYLHKDNMECYCFILNDKEYVDVKDPINILTLAALYKDWLEFIATGKESVQALAAIKELLDRESIE